MLNLCCKSHILDFKALVMTRSGIDERQKWVFITLSNKSGWIEKPSHKRTEGLSQASKKLPNFQVGEFQKKSRFDVHAHQSLTSERGDDRVG